MIKFIENMGIYSSSNIVELKNGEIAIRFETNLIKRPKPKIRELEINNRPRLGRIKRPAILDDYLFPSPLLLKFNEFQRTRHDIHLLICD